ncbi:MAG: hypothetical protein V4565_14545 [Bacteroidota bacterium]
MKKVNSDNIDWEKVFLENKFIIVNYQPASDCIGCAEINELFQRLDKQDNHKGIRFLWVDSRTNPIAEQFIKKMQAPFMATFKEGFLVECKVVKTEQELNEMIARLFKFQLEF